jgi:hypothetical protein
LSAALRKSAVNREATSTLAVAEIDI